MKNITTKMMAQGAVIAAVYVVLTLAFAPISFGAIQFRISEALCILPFFTVAAVPGVSIGCLLANILGGAALPDIIFGTLATLIGTTDTCKRNYYSVCTEVCLRFTGFDTLHDAYSGYRRSPCGRSFR